MAENSSIKWKNDRKLKGFLETCVKNNLGREEVLDLVVWTFRSMESGV